MSGPSTARLRGRRRFALASESFEALLAALDPDRERAGEEYERLRRKLIVFFDWRGCARAEELADEAIDRAGRRLVEGERILGGSAARYVLGVARFLVRESRAVANKWVSIEAGAEPAAVEPAPAGGEPDLDCLERCLAALAPESRALLLAYYERERGDRIAHRRELAGRLGIGANALRLRLHRVRALVEECVRGCMAERAPARDSRADLEERLR